MFETLGHGTQGKHLSLRHGFLRRIAIAQNAWQLRYFSDPAAINFFLALDGEIHDRTPVEGWGDCNPFRAWHIEEYLPHVTCPVLAIRRQAKGEVEVLMLADCRHSPHKDQPQATLEAMAGFIERIS